MGSGGKSGSTKTEVIDYRLTIQYAVCFGPVDAVEEIYIGEKPITFTDRENSYTDENSQHSVNLPGLFGGSKKGGGAVGQVHVYLGGATQRLSEFLASKMNRTPDTVSAYRDKLTIWFTGHTTEGFTWSTNLPTVPAVWAKVKRYPKGLSGDPNIGDDANPAHIIYECMTNPDWGAGYDDSEIDIPSFLDAAAVLRAESFGLSMKWMGQTTVENFINSVLRHIAAVRDYDTNTGKWQLILVRGGYDLNQLQSINPRNAELVAFQRKAWGEITNEIVLSWTNPETEKTETVTQQDASGMSIQGVSVTDSSRDFPGIRNQELAWDVAERELRASGTPLASVEVEASIQLRGISVGDIVWFDWDEVDANGDLKYPKFVCRVVNVKSPTRGDSKFSIGLVEDIFAYGRTPTASQEGLFEPLSSPASDVPNVALISEPYFMRAQRLGDAAAQAVEYPIANVSLLASTMNRDTRDVDVWSERLLPEQGLEYQAVALVPDLSSFRLTRDLPRETHSAIQPSETFVAPSLLVGGFIIAQTNTGLDEICLVTSWDGSVMTVKRGCLDTSPQPWPIGTLFFAVTRDDEVSDLTETYVAEQLKYKLLPTTSMGQLAINDATEHVVEATERAYSPTRPAGVRLSAGSYFTGTMALSESVHRIVWANRNRIVETVTVLGYDEPEVAPEQGQTTSLEFWVQGVLHDRVEGVSGSFFDFDISNINLSPGEMVEVRAYAVRDDFLSINYSSILLVVTP